MPGKEHLDAKERQIPISTFDWTINDVCKECNEGWLNERVEQPAEYILSQAMCGTLSYLDASAKSAIALWAAKTAAVRALMDPEPRAIPENYYKYIFDKLEPPPYTYVWLADTEYCGGGYTRHLRFSAKNKGVFETQRLHYTSFILGHMALYVIGATSEEFLMSTIPMNNILEEENAIQIWPPRLSYLDCPPMRVSLDTAIRLTTIIFDNE